jgi:ankyrin repeat protein
MQSNYAEFVPGVDPGLKLWLKLRKELRDARNSTAIPREIIVQHSKFRYRQYWNDRIYDSFTDSNNNDQQTASEDSAIESELSVLKNVEKSLNTNKLLYIMRERYEKPLFSHLSSSPADANSTVNNHGQTALHYAAMNGDIRKIQLLLKAGADINRLDNKHRSPLYVALNFPRIIHSLDILRLLIANGANVNIPDDRGFTPLHRACLLGDLTIITIILQSKAMVNVRDKKDKYAIEYAKDFKSVKKLFDQNLRFSGRKNHEKMWSYMMSHKLIESLFS